MRNINIYIIVIMIVIIIKNIFTPVVEGNTSGLMKNLFGPLKKKTTTSKNNLGNDVKILSHPLESQFPFTR